jgi:putative membrane protein
MRPSALAVGAPASVDHRVSPDPNDAPILAIERPDPKLWTYYLLKCLAIPPVFPVLVVPMYFRYHTLRYRFTAEGISMSWGILFRREIIIHYARIQDIHLRSNLIERWLGLAKILVQTASGNAAAEMTIEGILEYEAVRDFLYSKMRGVKDRAHAPLPAAPNSGIAVDAGNQSELAMVLREVAAELRRLRTELASKNSSGKESEHV